MSAHEQFGDEDEEIQVTSPTSYALRESLRRSSSSSSLDLTASGSRVHERQPSRINKNSFFSRAPPPPPPPHPPVAAVAPPSSNGSTNGGASKRQSGMTRPSSLGRMSDALQPPQSTAATGAPYHQQSLGPMSYSSLNLGGSTSSGSQQSSSNTLGSSSNTLGSSSSQSSFQPGNRRSSVRRSLFSRETFMLSREKESPATIPEGVPLDIKYEGFLTKRGHVFTNWKTRYFVLRGNVLEYFSGEDKNKKYGSVTVAKVAPWSGESHGFMFYTTKQIPYYVYAASETERANWLRALKEFCVEPEEVSCEGYLTKRGHLVPSQRMAYYVLNGTSLRHYADQAAYRENATALAEVEIRSVASWDGEANGLMFQTLTGSVFYAIADTNGEQQKWLQGVKKSTVSIPEPVACAGYLTKQGHKRKSWKKRYFILRGMTISYYSDYDMANHAKGKALAEVTVEDVQKWDGEPFGFMFMTSEQVPYYVYADNDRERNKWMSALRKLNAVEEEPDMEKKRCSNCNAVLTGSRFCGACGFNLRGTSGERSGIANRRTSVAGEAVDMRDDGDLDDENTAFDELEALSEGARTLLLAVMQTPDGVDVGGGDGAYPSRQVSMAVKQSMKMNAPNTFEDDLAEALSEVQVEEARSRAASEAPPVDEPSSPVAKPASPVVESAPEPFLPPPMDLQPAPVSPKRTSKQSTTRAKSSPVRPKLVPNFAVVEDRATKNASFTSFGSDEETKDEPAPVVVAPKPKPMTGTGGRRTVSQLAMESSSDEEDGPPKRKVVSKPTVPLPAKSEVFPKAARTPVDEDEEKEDEATELQVLPPAETASRKSSVESLELDTRGIAAFDEPAPTPAPASIAHRGSERAASKKDLYHYMERELDFTPLFVPSADSPVRCRFYSSMAYATAKKVILFLSDSGPLGLWKQDPTDQATTMDHKWSMTPYFSRAQEEGYGVVVCNPFSNSAVVYEAGGFERVVPIPNSTSPKEHVLFVWDNYMSKCKGQVSIVAYARGGALVKSILETYESSARDKLHRIAFIESKHEIDGSESPGVLELLGRRSINWEASFEPLGGQIVDSQARVGCVCLSIGYMPPNSEPDNTPATLEKSENPAFSFVGANPERPGMTAVVKHVRAELRRRKSMKITSKPSSKRPSNIMIIGETDADESSDMSAGGNDDNESKSTDEPDNKPTYFLPKAPRPPRSSPSSSSTPSRDGSDKRRPQISAKDFELLKVVGQGGFGKVFLCRKITPPHQGESYAMKVLKKQHVVSSGLVNTTMAERKILTEIVHPFVVKLHYAFQSESKLSLVMDYLSGGSLAFHLRRRRKFPEEWARFYAAEVAAAIAHLHSVNIIYRDAKLENVLMDHEGHVRITDFGLSKVGVSDVKGATTFCGTAAYIAPELLKGNAYGKAADWWSFGILLYEMIGGKPPYYHRNRDIMFQTILKQEWMTFSPNFSNNACSLIRGVSSLLSIAA